MRFFPAALRSFRVLSAAAVLLRAVLPPASLCAQERQALLDQDLDSLFDAAESGADTADGAPENPAAVSSAPVSLQGRGFAVDFSAGANILAAPGWSAAPWSPEGAYSTSFGAALNSTAALDIRFSREFRIRTEIRFLVDPRGGAWTAWSLGDLFLDYSVLDRVFFRAGKFVQNWGISRIFPAANLPSRIPADNPGGDSYILKADIPAGVGGVQVLALLRPGFVPDAAGKIPGFRSFGYGIKYNLALALADIDAGLFYHAAMPLRAFVSVKTTVRGTELYAESMGAVRHETWAGFSVSGNLGFARTFFGDLLTVNGEIFWNGESSAYWFDPGNEIQEAESSPFVAGFNGALNFIIQPGWPWNIRFVFRGLWAAENNTFHVTPGITVNPLPHLTVSLGFPAALGNPGGHYYHNNPDPANRPFSIVLLFSLGGSYRRAEYE